MVELRINQHLIFASIVLVIASTNIAYSKEETEKTSRINQNLQITTQNGDIDEYKASLAEVLVSKNESIAMSQLNKLLAKYRGTPLEPGLLFRKAELFIRQSKTARYFEFNSKSKLKSLVPPNVSRSSVRGKLESSINIYEEIERRYPNYSDLDLVYFNNAFVRQQINQNHKSELIYRKLLNQFPESFLVPDTHLALGEILYQGKNFKKALEQYLAVKEYPLARVYHYAVYKAGWSKYQLSDIDGAMKELEQIVLESKDLSHDDENKVKLSLRDEALSDLVLFFSESKNAKDAYSYFYKMAGSEMGTYIMSLSSIYESHGKTKELEVVLNDLIRKMPGSVNTPTAFKKLIDSEVNQKSYQLSVGNLAQMEKHCFKYFKDEMKIKTLNGENVKKASEDNEADEGSCSYLLPKYSLKLAVKFHKEWSRNFNNIKDKKLSKDDQKRLDDMGGASEIAYDIYLRNSLTNEEVEKVRYNYAELLFQRKKFSESSEVYFIVAQSIKDKKLQHDASYYAIVSLESAVGAKWSDRDERRFSELAGFYIKTQPSGPYRLEVQFKKGFIAYEKAKYSEALSQFKELSFSSVGKSENKIITKSQDLYLDILNIKKDYKELIISTQKFQQGPISVERTNKLKSIHSESLFLYAESLEKQGQLKEASEEYQKFIVANKDSKMADKAVWNLSQIYLKEGQLKLASDSLFSLYKNYPGSSLGLQSIQKSAELYEFMGNTKSASVAFQELSKRDVKNQTKWLKQAGDFYILDGQFEKGVSIYMELLKAPDAKMRSSIVAILSQVVDSGVYQSIKVKDLIKKYGVSIGGQDQLFEARLEYERKNPAQAFKVASAIIGDKNIDKSTKAKARFIQAKILKDEFEAQSVKTTLDRLELVLTIKSEKLDKAQRAFQAVMSYGEAESTAQAFYYLSEMYEHFVSSTRGIEIKGDISKKDKDLLLGELDKIIIPIEEKIVETLEKGLSFSKKNPSYTGFTFKIKNKLDNVNYKGTKFVNYEVSEPLVALPSSSMF